MNTTLEDTYPVVTVPLAPYIKPGNAKPIQTKRLRPIDALDIKGLTKELDANTITTIDIHGNPWSVVAVFSPYSRDMHVMLMDTGTRYIPGPEIVSEDEGTKLMFLWADIVKFFKDKNNGNRVFIGYNWSPRSWGYEEEQGGFQSIPTKWHPMFWSWPIFRKDINVDGLSWIDVTQSPPSFRRLNGENEYAESMAKQIQVFVDKLVEKNKPNLVVSGSSVANGSGFSICFNTDLENLLKTDNFFVNFIKPLSASLNEYFIKLTEIMVDCNCNQIDSILNKTSKGSLSSDEITTLRKLPSMRKETHIRTSLKDIGFSSGAIEELIRIVENRAKDENTLTSLLTSLLKGLGQGLSGKSIEEIIDIVSNKAYNENICNSWRKGFAYALVFEDLKENGQNQTELKIVPGAYIGSAGVVEAKGVVLKRPENAMLPEDRLLVKSKVLYQLPEDLKRSSNKWQCKP